MGLSRRFQNLIMDSAGAGAIGLRRVNLTRQLFGKTATTAVHDSSTSQIPWAHEDEDFKMTRNGWWFRSPISRFRKIAARLKMERIRLPSPIFTFHYAPAFGDARCFPISSSKVVLADHTGRAFLWHAADACNVVPMANLNKPKESGSISLFVPSADGHSSSSYGSLYIMEKNLKPDSTQTSDQFEALVHVKGTGTSEGMWHNRCVPLPPFIYRCPYTYKHITSYAVVGTRICISIEHPAPCSELADLGLVSDSDSDFHCQEEPKHDHEVTYWLDTTNNTWEVGKEAVLSTFQGKLEYVPELKLWFGFSAKDKQLAAMDVSAGEIPAQLVGDCREFDDPKGWWECDCPQLVNLGSGRFCIARFLQNYSTYGDLDTTEKIVVFTGVEVTPVVHDGNCSGSGNGEVKLQMKKHNSRYHADVHPLCIV